MSDGSYSLNKPETYYIRQATLEDCAEVTRIWLAGQQSQGITGKGDCSEMFRHKIEKQDDVFQVWVAEDEHECILGWQSLSPIINNPFLKHLMAESSTYICPNHRVKGVGRQLLVNALRHAEETPLKYVVAFVVAHNVGILRIIDGVGFKRIGLLPTDYKSPDSPEWMFIAYEVPKK